MLTAQVIEAMTDDQVQQELDFLATTFFGTARWKTVLAQLIGYERQAVQMWTAEGKRPPAFPLILLTALIHNRTLATAFVSMKGAMELAAELTEG